MKKTVFFLLMLLASTLSWQGFAQIEIGPQSGTTSNTPINGLYDYSYSQQIVYKSEINASGSISSLSFYFVSCSTTSKNDDWTIYMGHTTKTGFTTTTDWIPSSSMTQVFTGAVTFPAPNNMMTITFDNSFPYNNSDNLVIAVLENKADYSSTSFGKTADYAGSNRSIYTSRDDTPILASAPPTAKSRYNYLNNMILGGIQVACPKPTALTTTSVTGTSANVSWTDNASTSAYIVKYDTASGFDPITAGTAVAVSGTSTTLSPLSPNTTYYYYVQAQCGGGNGSSAWTGPVSFLTPQVPATIPYIDDFSTNQFIFVNGTQTNKWAFGSATGNSGNSMYISNTNGVSNAYSTSSTTTVQAYRDIQIPSGTTTAEFSFDWKAVGEGFTTTRYDYFRVWLVPSNYTPTAGSQISAGSGRIKVGVDFNNSGAWQAFSDYQFDISSFAGQTMRLVFEWRNDSSGGTQPPAAIDNIKLEIPSCSSPLNLNVVAVSTDSADIEWTAGGTETDWNISWGARGYTPGVGDLGIATVNTTATYQIADLDPNTAYDFYVQANCGGDQSSWAGPLAFRTGCVAFGDFTENFDTTTVGQVPSCWKTLTASAPNAISTLNVVANASAVSSPNDFQFANGNNATGELYLISPDLNNLAAANHQLRFSYKGSTNANLKIGTMSDPTDASTFTVIESVTTTSNYDDYLVSFNQSYSDTHIAFKVTFSSTYYRVYLDNLIWEPIPSCPTTSALSLTGLTANTADIAWTAGDSEANWNVSWGTPGYTPGVDAPVGTTSTTVTNAHIAGLSASTYYDIYVQANCGPGDLSTWTGPLTVYTDYCIPVGTNSARYVNNFSTTGGVENISNLASGFSPGGYGNFSATQKVSQLPSQTVNFSASVVGGSAGFRIWVDWNQDLVFDPVTEVAFVSSTYSTLPIGSITVPASALSGETRMRIVSHYNSTSGATSPCQTGFGDGEFEDYTFEVMVPEACSGTPDAGIATVNPASGNPGSSYTVAASGFSTSTGMSFQWQSNKNNQGWQNEGVASNSYASFSATAPSLIGDVVVWRLALTCIASTETDFSDTATFTTSLSYCTPSISSTVEPISRVIFGGIDNVSSASSTVGYEDFTSIVGNIEAGETYNFTAEGNTDGNYTSHFAVWMDWNQNGTFEAGERYVIGTITNSTGIDGQQVTKNIEVPYNALSGNTRMRVIKNFNSSPSNPCGSYSFGQAEDYTVNVAPFSGYLYTGGSWSPSNPSGVSLSTSNVIVADGTTSLTANTTLNNLTILSGATLNIEKILQLNGNIKNNGSLVFVSTATGNGELAPVSGASTITGNATVQRYMKDRRSYRMVSSAVTTTSSIHANWQEGAVSNIDNPAFGFGTHITGTTVDQTNGFDGTITGNPSMFTVNVATQQFEAIANTNVNTLTAGNPYLLFVRGSRAIDLGNDNAAGSTVLRATGSLFTGSQTQPFPTATNNSFVMFGNPYQSAVNVNSVFANSTNINPNHYYVYDPTLGAYGAYVTVNLLSPGSSPNQYLQPGQAAQAVVIGSGASIVFNESDKAPGNFTSTNRNPLSGSDKLNVELYTTENFLNGGSMHDSFGIVFGNENNNGITLHDAVKPMNFHENLGVDNNGTYLSLEYREMPQPAEVYPLYSTGYRHADYTMQLTVDGLENSILYLDDHFTGATTILEAGVTHYSFGVDVDNALSIATDRFSIRTEQRLGVDENSTLAGIRLFPNPLNGSTFYINAPLLSGEQLMVSINDLSGRRIFEQSLECRSNTVTVPMGNDLASGVYLVTLKHGGQTQTYRLIKE